MISENLRSKYIHNAYTITLYMRDAFKLWNSLNEPKTVQFAMGCLHQNAIRRKDRYCEESDHLKTLAREGRVREALEILEYTDGVDSEIYRQLLQSCGKMKYLTEGKMVHNHMMKSGFKPSVSIANHLVIMYIKCRSLEDARQVFDKMPERNVFSWNSILAGYTQHGRGDESLKLFGRMQWENVKPDCFTLSPLLKACANASVLEQGKQVHAHIVVDESKYDMFVGNALLDMYAKCGSIKDARHAFDRMPERDLISWTTMIAGYGQLGNCKDALQLFEQMRRKGMEADQFIFSSLLSACACVTTLEPGKQIHVQIIKTGVESHVAAGNALIYMYAKCQNIDNAYQVFRKMTMPDLVSWTAMISGYEQIGYAEEALGLFWEMQSAGLKLDRFILTSVISACASLAALEQGKQVHNRITESGLELDVFVESALVDMYAKCGSIVDARQVFNKMPKRDSVAWNTMMAGYAQHGHGQDSMELFLKMQQSGLKPDASTFVGLLSACSHAGLVDEGRHFFHSMCFEFKIKPLMDHYVCMVDLLGRAGYLEEADDFIKKMPVEPSAVVWRALLGACRTHGYIELGKQAAEMILELEPHNDATYILLSNIYSAAGRWDDVAKVRNLMKERKVRKKPGKSWIEAGNRVHSFVVEDKSHPNTKDIYATLERVMEQIKEVGYVPDTDFVLHDVEEELKEQKLSHHSEKLAIAFGIISTPEETPIRILKNLRVCGDCHKAIKFISKVINREIVMRDANRFHHFKDGLCSCGDYW